MHRFKNMHEKLEIRVCCGTYDGTVFGITAPISFESCEPKILKTVFADPDAHNGSIKCIDVSGDLCVSGGSDDTIQVYSFTSSARLGCLELHSAPVKCLKLICNDMNAIGEPSHIISGSDDCTVALWKRDLKQNNSWECVRQMKNHKGSIKCVSIHPTHRLLISLSEDKTIRMWNLARGRQAYTLNIKKDSSPENVELSRCGTHLFMSYNNKFDLVKILSTSNIPVGTRLAYVEFEKPFSAVPCIFNEINDFVYIVCGSMQNLRFFRCSTMPESLTRNEVEEVGSANLPGKRIKNLKVLPHPTDLETRLLVVTTTDADCSYIRVYKVRLLTEGKTNLKDKESFCLIATLDVPSARITTMSASLFTDEPLFREKVFEKIIDACEYVEPSCDVEASDDDVDESENESHGEMSE